MATFKAYETAFETALTAAGRTFETMTELDRAIGDLAYKCDNLTSQVIDASNGLAKELASHAADIAIGRVFGSPMRGSRATDVAEGTAKLTEAQETLRHLFKIHFQAPLRISAV